jgi:hypothetical protein
LSEHHRPQGATNNDPHILAAATSPSLCPRSPSLRTPRNFDQTSTIGQIRQPGGQGRFAKVLPEVAVAPQLEQAREMTIEDVKGMVPEYFPEEKVKELDVELAKIK